MANEIRVKSGTRAQIDAAGVAGQIKAREPYLITDEQRLGIGIDANTMASMLASADFTTVRWLTQAAYDALSPPDAKTLYVISDAVPAFYMLRQIKVSANITLGTGNVWCRVRTGTAAVTITLPAAPSDADLVQITDADGNVAINNITIARNGKTIGGVASNFTINAAITGPLSLVYDAANNNWEYA